MHANMRSLCKRCDVATNVCWKALLMKYKTEFDVIVFEHTVRMYENESCNRIMGFEFFFVS